jgi:hypothetical protein
LKKRVYPPPGHEGALSYEGNNARIDEAKGSLT